MVNSWVLSNQFITELYFSNQSSMVAEARRLEGRELHPNSIDEIYDIFIRAYPGFTTWTRSDMDRLVVEYKYLDFEVDGEFCFINLKDVIINIRNKKIEQILN